MRCLEKQSSCWDWSQTAHSFPPCRTRGNLWLGCAASYHRHCSRGARCQGRRGSGGEPRAALSLPGCPCQGAGGQDPASELLPCLELRRLGRWELPGMDTVGKGLLLEWDPAVASPASPVGAEMPLLGGQPWNLPGACVSRQESSGCSSPRLTYTSEGSGPPEEPRVGKVPGLETPKAQTSPLTSCLKAS